MKTLVEQRLHHESRNALLIRPPAGPGAGDGPGTQRSIAALCGPLYACSGHVSAWRPEGLRLVWWRRFLRDDEFLHRT